jgi:hypothetical protein
VIPTNVLYDGREEPLPARVRLWAGPLSLVYQQGDLRYLRLGEREVLRRVYVAVRDRNWGTIPATLSSVRILRREDAFEITFDARHWEGEIDFAWRGRIVGTPEGAITYTMAGEALTGFLKNRIGLCVLHPMEAAGAPCTVEHVDGGVEEGAFPRLIAPHQPFLGIRAIRHRVAEGVWATVRLEGDTFEMEDQRNWTDASFKTYSTPLALPIPVRIDAGTRVEQSLHLTIAGAPAKRAAAAPDRPLAVTLGERVGRLPRLGLETAGHGRPLGDEAIERLRALSLGHLRVEVDPAGSDAMSTLRRAWAEAGALGVPLQLALVLGEGAEEGLERLVGALGEMHPRVAEWLVYGAGEAATSAGTADLARRRLAAYDPAIPVGGGARTNYTELNRNRPPEGALDLLAYAITPQVHAFDNASLVETLTTQPVTVESARAFAGGRPIAVGPVTLKPRLNPAATGPEPPPPPGALPREVDPRQMSLFGAGWTLGSIAALAAAGAASVTYYQTTGWLGVMETAEGSPLPAAFISVPGGVYPVYHVFRAVGDLAAGEVLAARVSDPLRLAALALRSQGRQRLLVANLGPEAAEATVRGLPGGRAALRRLDEHNAEAAMAAPEAYWQTPPEEVAIRGGEARLTLVPYGLAWLDIAQ